MTVIAKIYRILRVPRRMLFGDGQSVRVIRAQEIASRRPFWRDPRRRFLVTGTHDADEAMEAPLAKPPDGYEWAETYATQLEADSFLVTRHFRPALSQIATLPDAPLDARLGAE